ncbi:MAG: triose-phosphate isomerase, partial [Pseudomonadota bacterium]
IRKALADRAYGDGLRVLSGGSANAENAGGFFGDGGVDGALVGGASLKPDAFGGIIAAAAAA